MVIVWSLCNLKMINLSIWQLLTLHTVLMRVVIKEQEPKGECVLVIEGKSRQEQIEEERQKWEEMSIQEHMDYYMNQGIQKKEAMKMVAKDRGVGKRDIYQALL